MSYLEGTHILAGSNLFVYEIEYKAGEDSINADTGLYTPAHFYAFHTFNNGLSFGLGIYTPYGLGGAFPEEWVGRYIFTETEQNVYLFNPVISVDLNNVIPKFPKICLSAGLRLAYGTTFMRQNLTFSTITIENGGVPIPWATALFQNILDRNWTGEDTIVDLDTDGFGTGFNLGLLWRIRDNITVGLAYQSKIRLTFEGTAEFRARGTLLC